MWKKYFTARQVTDKTALHAGYLSLQTHTRNMWYLMAFQEATMDSRPRLMLRLYVHCVSCHHIHCHTGKHEENRPLGKPRCRWNDNIKIDLQEVRWGQGLDGSGSEQEQDSCKCGTEHSGSIKCGEFLDKWDMLASQEGLCSVWYIY